VYLGRYGIRYLISDRPTREEVGLGVDEQPLGHLGGDDSELHRHFEKLSVGGMVTMPLEKQAWGDEAGTLVDRFGTTWMVNITQQQQQQT